MIDMSKPELRQAYLMGIEAARAEMSAELDRVAVVTEKRIVKDLEHFRKQLVRKRMPSHSRIVVDCIAIVQGEVVSND